MTMTIKTETIIAKAKKIAENQKGLTLSNLCTAFSDSFFSKRG
jgi:hypothetical protein